MVRGVHTTLHPSLKPDFWIGAVKVLAFPFTQGTPIVVMPRFDPVQFCANIEKYKINIALVVPPVLVVLARHPCELLSPLQPENAEPLHIL